MENAYFPCDPQAANFDSNELVTLLAELENILDSQTFDDVIIGADFNWDRTRNTDTDFVSTSTIDHFLEMKDC